MDEELRVKIMMVSVPKYYQHANTEGLSFNYKP